MTKPSTDWLPWLCLFGAAVCLFVACCIAGSALSFILAYVAIVLVMALGARSWISRIEKHPDLDAGGREQNKNAVLVAVTFLGAIATGLLVVCIATTASPHSGTNTTSSASATSTALLWALGSLLSGGLIGFLFSLPKITNGEAAGAEGAPSKPATSTPAGANSTATSPAPSVPSKKQPAGGGFQVNTSLNEIADWLTKIIVGVSLVNAQTAYQHFVLAAKRLGAGLTGTSTGAGEAFAAGLIVTFFCLGLLGTYLLTRLWVSAALLQAGHSGVGAFTGAGVDEQDLQILEDETRGFSEAGGDMALSAAAQSVASRIAKLDLDSLRTWREQAAWAKAKAALGDYADSIKGYDQAVQLYPESSRLRLDFAVALFLAANAAEKAASSEEQILRQRQQNQLREAYNRLNELSPAEVRKNIYKSLTHTYLYVPAPDGFTKAAKFGLEYVGNPRWLPSGGIWVNLACAYGQNAAWLMQASGEPTPRADLRAGAIEAIREALRQDDDWKLRLQLSLQHDHPLKLKEPKKYADEDDLEVFESDSEIRTLIGLPTPNAPETPTGLKVEQISSTSLKASWAKSPRAATYRPFRKIVGLDMNFVALAPIAATELLLDGLSAKAVVHFQVSACNATGESARTAEIQTILT